MTKITNENGKIVAVSDLSGEEFESMLFHANMVGFYEGEPCFGETLSIDDSYLVDFCVNAYEEEQCARRNGQVFSVKSFASEYARQFK